MFSARYALSPYIKQIRIVLKGLMQYRDIVILITIETSRDLSVLQRGDTH